MNHEDARAAELMGQTIARAAMQEIHSQAAIDGMDDYERLVAAAAAAQEVFYLVGYLAAGGANITDASILAHSYGKMGLIRGVEAGLRDRS
jgi:basic membrane lipoprotein Med (substrate-binding protein (PBP1-ABC) superfamily)